MYYSAPRWWHHYLLRALRSIGTGLHADAGPNNTWSGS
jgi:hypothetical protein